MPGYPAPMALSIVTVDLAETRVPSFGHSAAVGVLIPTRFGKITLTDGHGIVVTVRCPFVVPWYFHSGLQATESGEVHRATYPMPG